MEPMGIAGICLGGWNSKPKAASGESVLGRGQRAVSAPAMEFVGALYTPQQGLGRSLNTKCILDALRAQKTYQVAANVI